MKSNCCSCEIMADKGICEHLVRVALLTGIVLLGLEVKSKLTIRAARVNGGKKIDLSVSVDEEFDNAMNKVHGPVSDPGNVGDIDPVVATDLAIAPVVDTNLAIDQVDPELVAHDASDITEEFLESIEDKTNTYYSNPPHRQAAIPKCLAITPPKTSKPKAKPKLKVPKVPTESQRASTRTRKAVDKYGNNVGYDN